MKDNCTSVGGQCKSEVTNAYSRPPPADLAHSSLRARSADGGSEQFHLIGGHPDEVTIVFMHPGNNTPQTVEIRVNGSSDIWHQSTVVSSYSFFMNPASWNGYSSSSRGSEYFPCAQGGWGHYQNASCFYTSDMIHKAQVTNLTGGTAYDYRVLGEASWRTFRTPPPVGSPISIAVTGDLGQTTDSHTTMLHMMQEVTAGDADLVLFPGDLSYADGYALDWDSYGRLGDFLWGSVPAAYGVGNHEYTNGFENFVNFLPRYGWESSQTTSSSPLWYSFDAGLAHVIMLCSYCDTAEGSPQHKWLQADLESVDRSQTPWVVAAWHVPFYTSSEQHTMKSDGYQQREALEGLLYTHKLDVAFQGHVHAYERTEGVYQNETKCDGPVYITIGDGGNHEGPACGFYQNLSWSAKKEYSFGFGTLKIINSTDAEWVWRRNQDGEKVHADVAPLKTASTRCGAMEQAAAPTAITV